METKNKLLEVKDLSIHYLDVYKRQPVDKAIFRPGMVAFDAAYNPSVTKFLADAADCGCTTFNLSLIHI